MKLLSGLQHLIKLAPGLTLSFVASLALSGCGSSPTPVGKPPVAAKITSISLTPAAVTVNVGQTDQFVATAKYSDGTSAVIRPDSWTSSNPSVLTISASGLGTAISYGQPTVSASFSGITGTVPISVHGGALSVVISGTNSGSVTLTSSAGATSTMTQSATVDLPPGNVTVFGNGSVIGTLQYLPITQLQTVALPDGGTASVTVDYSAIIPTTTKVLDAAGMSSLQISADQSSVTISSASPVAAGLNPQDVLVVGICDAAPSGFLATVVSVTSGSGTITATVEPAALTDAIQQGNFDISQTLGPATLSDTSRNQLLHLRQHPFTSGLPRSSNSSGVCDGNSDTVVFPYSNKLIDDSSGTLTLSGELDLCAAIKINATWGLSSIDTFNGAMTGGVHTGTQLTSSVNGSFSQTTDIPPYKYKPIPIEIGGVPIIVTPTLTPVLTASGKADATLSSGLTTDTSVSFSVSYVDGDWTSTSAASSPVTAATPTSAQVNADVKGTAGFKLDLAFYQQLPINATVSLAPDAYLEVKAGTNQNPCWSLYAGLEGSVSTVGKFLSKKLGPYSTGNKNIFNQQVAQADGPCFTVAVTPSTSTLEAGQTLQLTANETNVLGNPVSANFIWSTSDASAATVDQNGVVTGIGGGSATITATDPKSLISGLATISVGCAGKCYLFTFPDGLTNNELFSIYFYGTAIAPTPAINLSNLPAGATYTIPVGQYYPTTPGEELFSLFNGLNGPVHYQLSIPSPFVFEIITSGVNYQTGQSFLDYTFPTGGGGAFVDAYVPTPSSGGDSKTAPNSKTSGVKRPGQTPNPRPQ